jgi:glyoxylase-like metal-dependent hydrolase (beta-lactamase superfamily II)
VRSATLPPATHTNCYVLGNSELLIVDPGAIDDAETDRLLSFIRELKEEYFKPTAVVLTHHHFDHISGAARVMSELKLPLWCHERTEQATSLKAERHLVDGELIEHAGMKLRVLHTPGHDSGHICLVHEASMAALVGDMVAGVGTIVIDPPDGDMAEYLRQLERLKALGVRTLYPAHGSPVPDGPQKLQEYLEHRAFRENKVVSVLTSSPQSLEHLVPLAYDDVPPEIYPIAERNLCAILLKLEGEGRVRKTANQHFHL